MHEKHEQQIKDLVGTIHLLEKRFEEFSKQKRKEFLEFKREVHNYQRKSNNEKSERPLTVEGVVFSTFEDLIEYLQLNDINLAVGFSGEPVFLDPNGWF